MEEVETLEVLLEEEEVCVGVGGKSNLRITSGDDGRWREESRCVGGGETRMEISSIQLQYYLLPVYMYVPTLELRHIEVVCFY